MRRAGRAQLFGVIALVVTGCVPLAGGWSAELLESRFALPEGHRLGDTSPHFWPRGDDAWLFLCRFDTDETIEVALPEEATDVERADLELALALWERAGLGVRFRRTSADRARIVVRYVEPGDRGGIGHGTGVTVTDCEVGALEASVGPAPTRLDARLVRATIFLRRSSANAIGREVPLGPDERLGAALHELGHALGFSGHVRDGTSVMTPTTEWIRDRARFARASHAFGDASLAALYAVPNGTVVGRVPLSAQAIDDLAAGLRYAAASEWRGPFVRVGDPNAQLHFRRGDSMAGRLPLVDYAAQLQSGEPLRFAPNTFVRLIRARSATGADQR